MELHTAPNPSCLTCSCVQVPVATELLRVSQHEINASQTCSVSHDMCQDT